MIINFKRARKVKLPQYSTKGAAALDFYIPDDLGWESQTLLPGQSVCIPSGICIELPIGTAMIVLNKSSRGKQGLMKAAELIDEDYRGEIHLNVFNVSNSPLVIRAGEKLVQIIVIPYYKIQLNESNNLSETNRGSSGFGSTGLG